MTRPASSVDDEQRSSARSLAVFLLLASGACAGGFAGLLVLGYGIAESDDIGSLLIFVIPLASYAIGSFVGAVRLSRRTPPPA